MSHRDQELREALNAAKHRSAVAAATYQTLKKVGKLKSHRIITYRCPSRCLLLDVVNLPQGVLFHQPPYKLPPAVNEANSSDRGRRANTSDGDLRWIPQTYFANDCVNVSANCSHVHQVVVDKAEIQADIHSGHTEMMLDATGKRCPG